MKSTASNPNATTQRQRKGSRLNDGPGAAAKRERSSNAASSSHESSERAKRGEPLTAENQSERSPKQENL